MSQPRFAPVTANLLARKGDAAPSAPRPWLPALAPPPFAEPPVTNVTAPAVPLANGTGPQPPTDPAEKPHRIMVALSAREYETLGIAAVKKNTTRHQIARAAMDAYFAELAHEFHDRCRCVSDAAEGGPCCRDG